MAKHIVIVESPAKSKTIEKYLGKDYEVLACFGHVRDLPSGTMGVDLTTFKPKYTVITDKKKLITEIKKKLKTMEDVWLATDPDREGEAIAWHVKEALKLPDERYKRITFNEITKSAVLTAIKSPRKVNDALVNAQQARRILDRVVGYEMSPILWKKLKRGLSAGRVQSVAVRLIVEKEREIEAFNNQESYKVTADFEVNGSVISADLNESFSTKEEALVFLNSLINMAYKISNIQQKESFRSPRPPFTTSSLQQEASVRLGYSVSRTMIVAQKLYEAGHITYMRTDGTTISNDAKAAISSLITNQFGKEYLKHREYETKSKGAQEAHEAIRPSNINVEDAGSDESEKRLYQLIRQRTLACQMANAKTLKTTVYIPVHDHVFEAKGEVVAFDGFLKVYPTSTKDKLLPDVSVGDTLNEQLVQARQRFSKPPSRFTEASLVKQLEELGIGRPSTFAPTITTIQKREYVERIQSEGKKRDVVIIEKQKSDISERIEEEGYDNQKGRLQPTDIGMLVTDYLVKHFDRVMNYQFTAEIEAEFDSIMANELDWTDMLKRFYAKFHPKIESAEASDERINEERSLGDDPDTGKPVYAKIGKYGPFIQLGNNDDDDKRSVSLTPDLKYSTITFDEALSCLAYPIQLGDYNGDLVSINLGRYGVYIKHGKKNVSMKDIEVNSLEDAITLIQQAEKEAASRHIQQLDHKGDLIQVLNGRYGPYISYKKKNYKIPKTKDPKALTLAECVELIEAAPKKRRKRK